MPVARTHELYHRLPTGLEPDEERRLATRTVARLRSAGCPLQCDPDFETEAREAHYLPLGAQVANLADDIRSATTSDEVADVLAEVTAAYDGILAGLSEVLTATADFHQDLGGPVDGPMAERLRDLAVHRLDVVAADLRETRTDLADRRQSHPRRSVCGGEVPPDEREASAACACPPPPPLPPPPAPATAARRR
ncbi:hypothetical protein ACIQXD_32855 [Streptomyces uncialis]|uniref:hypothetical protein n=1 Tax=Streptomyces uncialis TaxID=1048205 RepID=UPI0037F18E60